MPDASCVCCRGSEKKSKRSEKNRFVKKKWAAILVMLMLVMAGAVLAACSDKDPAGRFLHVSADGSDETGDGSAEHPFATPAYAAAQAEPGTEVIVHGGIY